jgi:glycosyltransferase involved in cell wall biosynthesis
MKFCIPIKDESRGGMYTFLRLFRRYLATEGVPVDDDIDGEYDILFVNSFMVPYETVLEAKRTHPVCRVVHRVDGSTLDYGGYVEGDIGQARVSLLADLVVFQSVYSRFSTRRKHKVIARDGPIVFNPVDTTLFTPAGSRVALPGRIRVCNASFSLNPGKGTAHVARLARENPDVTFILCGRYPELPSLPNIHMAGHLTPPDLAAVMRSCDVFLHLAENDPCPNVVTEALASGLPVLFRDSGGTPELVADCGAATDPDRFRSALDGVLARRDRLSRQARERAERQYAPSVIFPQYLAAIGRARRRPLPSRWRLTWAALCGYPVLGMTRRAMLAGMAAAVRRRFRGR